MCETGALTLETEYNYLDVLEQMPPTLVGSEASCVARSEGLIAYGT